jgi:cell division septation protein DedD
MQLNNPKNNTSNLIKQSESAKKKARRRLIGSIFMLFTALIILLNVTTKVKPIPVSPKVIEIANASAPTNASTPVKQSTVVSSAPINTSAPVIANINSSEPVDNGYKAGVLARDKTNSSQTTSTAPVSASPIIITMNIGKKPTPEDILNGNTTVTPETIYYIQIAASQNKPGLQAIQTNLANNGIKTFIQNGKNNMFRLRIGPFRNKDDANSKLAEIQSSLNQ